MEQILVLSDIHNGVRYAREVIEQHPACKTVLFLGDGVYHIDTFMRDYPDRAFVAVRGNCDFLVEGNYPTETVLELCGHRLLLCHGHTFSVKSGTSALLVGAVERGADIALYGHTHVAKEEYVPERGVYLFNPGSIGEACYSMGSYGILHLDEKTVLFSVGEIG